MRQTIYLGVLSIANIAIAYLFQWYVLVQLGPGAATDALFAGMALPQIVLVVVSASLMHVLVPLLSGEDEQHIHNDAWAFFILVGVTFSVLAGLLFITAQWWTPITVPGFDSAGKALTVELTRIQLIGMVFSALNSVQWAAYHARRKFIWVEFSPILAGIVSFLILVWALPRYGVIAAAWVNTLRILLQTLLLIGAMGRPVWPNLNNPALKMTWHRIKPLLAGTIYYKTDPLVDRFLMSSAASGSISMYYFVQQLYGAANQVLNKAIATPLMTKLSMYYKKGDCVGYRGAYRKNLLAMLLISLVGLVILLFFGMPIFSAIIGYGRVGQGNISDMYFIAILLWGAFMGGAGGQICSISFYAKGDTVSPTKVSVIAYSIYIPAKIMTYYFFGVPGLAVVTSVYYMMSLLVQMYLLNKGAV